MAFFDYYSTAGQVFQVGSLAITAACFTCLFSSLSQIVDIMSSCIFEVVSSCLYVLWSSSCPTVFSAALSFCFWCTYNHGTYIRMMQCLIRRWRVWTTLLTHSFWYYAWFHPVWGSAKACGHLLMWCTNSSVIFLIFVRVVPPSIARCHVLPVLPFIGIFAAITAGCLKCFWRCHLKPAFHVALLPSD